jgi:hypothetical protein
VAGGFSPSLYLACERIGEHVQRVDEVRRQLRQAVAN